MRKSRRVAKNFIRRITPVLVAFVAVVNLVFSCSFDSLAATSYDFSNIYSNFRIGSTSLTINPLVQSTWTDFNSGASVVSYPSSVDRSSVVTGSTSGTLSSYRASATISIPFTVRLKSNVGKIYASDPSLLVQFKLKLSSTSLVSGYYISSIAVENSWSNVDCAIGVWDGTVSYLSSSGTAYASVFFGDFDITGSYVFMSGTLVFDVYFVYSSASSTDNDGAELFTLSNSYYAWGGFSSEPSSVNDLDSLSDSVSDSISSQTGSITNGYDSSSGDSAASDFSTATDTYQSSETSLFTSSKSGLDDFETADLASVSTVVTGMSFVTSIMTSVYDTMGGSSGGGAHVVLSVLFTVVVLTMVIGLAKRYQSSGGVKHKKG